MEKLIYAFTFEEENRSRLTFSDATKVRLNPATHLLELAPQRRDPVTKALIYPTDENLWIQTWVANPRAVRQWLNFYCEPSTQPTGAAVKFKLTDGLHNYYWNGTTWAVASTANWNTLQEVNANIDHFPVTNCLLGVVINLRTTDTKVTPTVEYLDLLMSCDVEYLYSLIADSMGQSLKDEVRAPIDFAVDAPGGKHVSLSALETSYDIVGIEGVYDHRTDPKHLVNLLHAFDSSARDIELTVEVTRGYPLWIKMLVAPEVYINWGSQDYVAVEKIPALVIDSITTRFIQNVATQEVKDVALNRATVRRMPLRLTLSFTVLLLAEKNRTLLAMMSRALKYAATHPTLTWRDLDQAVALRAPSPLSFSPRPNLSDKHQTTFNLSLENVYLWLRPEEYTPLVERLNLQLSGTHQDGPLWADTQDE